MTANHHFTKPAEVQRDELFAQTRKYNGLNVNIPVHASHVVDVTDTAGIQWEQAAELAGAQFANMLGGDVALQARSALVRSALRPASNGGGRGRWR
jgi:hypothetical protein